MNDTVIRAENLSKRYAIGHGPRYRTLREALTDAARTPFRALRSANGRHGEGGGDFIWALKDVSFEVRQGEIVGIIGGNGAGKSTLLKILSRITDPTAGRAEIRGRVGSLLEVGTGFHPELTGRENVFLNGAILGMRKQEIARKFDEIVAFAEVEKFIDTPVKHYSSGMYVRLAFAVAAHLDTEVLFVDEVLAVGDAAFQKKCLGKMDDVARHGRTVIFVSHNMGAVQRLCNWCVWLDSGLVKEIGPAGAIINNYLFQGGTICSERCWGAEDAPGDENMRLCAVRLRQGDVSSPTSIDISRPFSIEIETEILKLMREVCVNLMILSAYGVVLHSSEISVPDQKPRHPGYWISTCNLPAYALNHGTYTLTVGADVPNVRLVFFEEGVLSWSVEALSPFMSRYSPESWKGVIGPGLPKWTVKTVEAAPVKTIAHESQTACETL